jgi:hypothetical protein
VKKIVFGTGEGLAFLGKIKMKKKVEGVDES